MAVKRMVTEMPFDGMTSTLNAQGTPPGRAHHLTNLIPEPGGGARTRPGYRDTAATYSGTWGTNARTQALAQFTTSGGTTYTIAVVAGVVYTLAFDGDVTSGTWTERVTQAQLSGASVTFSTTAKRTWWAVLNDQIVFTDGVNTPWMWDGTSGGGITDLTSCPVLYGRPVIHYGKVVGIKNTERSTIVWSEENDPATGYETGGYNNAWTLSQTATDPLYSLLATNRGLYYFRDLGIGLITGAVTPDFQNAGVRDEISTSVGTRSTAGTLEHDGKIWFVSSIGQPWAIAGGQLVPIWKDMALSVAEEAVWKAADYPSAYVTSGNQGDNTGWIGAFIESPASVQVEFNPVTGDVVFGAFGADHDFLLTPMYNFDPQSGRLRWVTQFFSTSAMHYFGPMATVKLTDGTKHYPTLMLAGRHTTTLSRVLWMSREAQYDEFDYDTTYDHPKAWVITGRVPPDQEEVDLAFDELAMRVGANAAATDDVDIFAQLYTSNRPTAATASTIQSTNPDVVGTTTGSREQLRHIVFGFNQHGRWAAAYVLIAWADSGELTRSNITSRGQVTLGGLTLRYFVLSRGETALR